MRLFVLTVMLLFCSVPKGDAALLMENDSSAPSAPPTEDDASTSTDPSRRPARKSTGDDDTMPSGLKCILEGYKDAVTGIERKGSDWFLVINNKTRLRWDDGKKKSFEEKLRRPDLEDQLSIRYPLEQTAIPLKENDDPGRIRAESFFKAVYGDSPKAVKSRLVEVDWLPKRLGKKLLFNRLNGAAEALKNVSRQLDANLSEDALRYVSKPSGTFNWRYIAGTERLSAHAFGIAVDIHVKGSAYWRWDVNRRPLKYQNQIPLGIIKVFENNGFIWGGKWYHYDTMHFEYRPELLSKYCLR